MRVRCHVLAVLCLGCSNTASSTADGGLGADVSAAPDVAVSDVAMPVDLPDVDVADVPLVDGICTGQPGLVLAYQLVGGGPTEPGSGLLSQNGYTYLFLDGACRYWARADARSSPRTGQTTAAEVERLLHPSQIGALAGAFQGASADGASVRLATRGAAVDCSGGCAGGNVPPSLRQIASDAYDATQTLWQRGEEVAGALRILAVSGVKHRPGAPTFGWPLSPPIADVSVPFADAGRLGLEASRAVTSPADLASLLDLRRRHLALSEFQRGSYVAIVEGGASYALWMRRTIPLEDERGVVPVAALLSR